MFTYSPNCGPPSESFPSEGSPSQGLPSEGFPSQGFPSEGFPTTAAVPPKPLRRREIAVAALAFLAVAALGPLVGLVWAWVSPRAPAIRLEGDAYQHVSDAPEQAVAADGWFSVLGLGLGILIAILAYAGLRRYRGVPMLLAITAGSLVSAYLAWRVGEAIGADELIRARAAAPGERIELPLHLGATGLDPADPWWPRITGAAAFQALAAAVIYTTLSAFSPRPDLDPDPAE